MTVLEKYPHTYNYLNLTEDNAQAQYKNGRLMINVLKNEIVILFSWINFQNIRVASGEAEGLGSFFLPVFLVILFGTLLFFMIGCCGISFSPSTVSCAQLRTDK